MDRTIEAILTKLENEVSRDTALRVTQNRSGRSPKSSHAEATQALERLMLQERIDELKNYVFGADSHHVQNRLKTLKAQLERKKL